MLPPRPTLATAILLVGALAWSATVLPPPVSSLEEAARWEGQDVRLEGWVTELHAEAESLRFTLADGGHQIPVRAPSPTAEANGPGLASGDRVQAAGRLGRWQGQLRLDVEDLRAIEVVQAPAVASPAWAELGADPAAWTTRPFLLHGEVARGRLQDGSHSVALGEGPWPASGRVQVRGFLREDPACLCHRLDAREVWPWTP